jgi:methylglutaconyl-CoA hydratase
VHGNVFGGGLGLVAACDIVFAEKDTKFSFSEVKLGLVPAVISPFLRRKVRDHYLRDYMITGDIFGVHAALDMGLIHKFGDLKDNYADLDQKMASILKAGKEAVRITKKLLNDLPALDWPQAREHVVKIISERRVSSEGQEGLKAFLEKRKPNWL